MTSFLHPSLLLFISIFLLIPLKLRISRFLILILSSYLVYFFYTLPLGFEINLNFLGLNLRPVFFDSISRVFLLIFSIVTFIGTIFNFYTNSKIEVITPVFYLLGAIGVVLAGDFFTFFCFWELLTIAALLLIANGNQKNSLASAKRYLLFHIIGGLILLSGIVLYYYKTNSLLIINFELGELYSYLIFLGIGVNCAFPTLHTWLTDSYPKASPGGTIFLSALTTKTAVYSLCRVFPGNQELIYLGCIMLVFPVFYAVIENDLRKVLSYSLINQVGFMLVGIGIGTEMSINGSVSHAFVHIIYKALLFMSMGAVLFRTGKSKATELGGLYKSMPLTCTFCIIGALSISAFPFFSGFITKSLIISSAVDNHLLVVWFFLLFASAGVLEHAGIKIPYFTFFAHDSGLRVKEAPKPMLIAMFIASCLCVIVGIFPSLLYGLLPYEVDYQPYTLSHIVSQLQLLSFAILAFIILIITKKYPPEVNAINLDFDYFYRKIFSYFYKIVDRSLNRLNSNADRFFTYHVFGKISTFLISIPQSFINSIKFILNAKKENMPMGISLLFAVIVFLILMFLI